MIIDFCKYQGTGNDFVMIDNRADFFDKKNAYLIEAICNRRLGIGADGLILLEKSASEDFRMTYFNADGKESSMCGNGGRCIVSFAHSLDLVRAHKTSFEAIDGIHRASIRENGSVELEMKNVMTVEQRGLDYYLDTGSPHYVVFVNDLNSIDVITKGREIRYNEEFNKKGTNVNFVQIVQPNEIKVLTYERGVEDETWSCGTGVTAAAIATAFHLKHSVSHYFISTKGGALEVTFSNSPDRSVFEDVFLSGPAKKVYEGQIEI